MNILFVAPYSEYNAKIEAALRRTEHRVVSVPERSAPLWSMIRKISPLRRMTNSIFNKRIVHATAKQKFDAMLVIKGTTVSLATLEHMKQRGIKTANWFPENGHLEVYRNWLAKYQGAYDIFMSFDSSLLGGVFLPFGVEPEPWMEATPDNDLVFVGAPYPERVRALEVIKGMGVSLKVYGWKGWKATSFASLYGGPLSSEESVQVYRRAKIVLNMNTEPPVAGVNLKTFEIAAAGGFQLSDYRSDVTKLFEIDKEITIFKNEEELVEKVRYYLAHETERKHIARAGWERVQRDHTLDKRIHEITTLLRNL